MLFSIGAVKTIFVVCWIKTFNGIK